jgi:hypothetical protein
MNKLHVQKRRNRQSFTVVFSILKRERDLTVNVFQFSFQRVGASEGF